MACSLADDQPATWIPDLEEICLSAISSNWDMYNAIFKLPPSSSSILRDHFEFLERRYTERLLSRLKSEKKLKADHWEFFINPHLKELDLVGIEEHLLCGLLEVLQTRENSIQSLKAKARDHAELKLYERVMSSLPNVENIDFKGVSSHEFVKEIGRSCPLVKVLQLECDEIHGVNLYNDGISDIIRRCPGLEVLLYVDTIGVLYRMHTTGSFFTRLEGKNTLKKGKKYVLKTLSSYRDEFSKYSLSDALKVCAIICPYVSCLHIDHLQSEKAMYKCLLFPLLEDIKFDRISRLTFSCLKKFLNTVGKQLTSVDLPYVAGFSVPELAECCPNLRSLTVRNARTNTYIWRNKGTTGFAGLPDLTTLKIENGNFYGSGAVDDLKSFVSTAKGIRTLSFEGCRGLSGDLLTNLELYRVVELDLSWTDVSSEPLKELLLHGSLQKLIVKYCYNIRPIDYFTLNSCPPNGARNTVDILWNYYDAATDCLIPRRRS